MIERIITKYTCASSCILREGEASIATAHKGTVIVRAYLVTTSIVDVTLIDIYQKEQTRSKGLCFEAVFIAGIVTCTCTL